VRSKEPVMPDRLLSTQQLADVLQVPVGTIYQWRHRGQGPKGLRVGRHIRFDPSDVARWVETQKRLSVLR
jgi:excisionase family DNA binding protein